MKDITIKDIIRVTGGKQIGNYQDITCEHFSKDTRTIKPGDVYIGIKGEKFDGNLLYKEAIEKGALVCILQGVTLTKKEEEKYKNICIIIVKDTIEALGKIAKYKRSLYNIPVIAVTGSVGKTSTKDIIASVVAQKYRVHKTQGNFNNNIGLPLTILKMKEEEALVIEMGMNHFGEISYLTQIAKPTIVVITNIGTSHIGNLGSRENILKAKLEILEGLQDNGTVIVNQDNDLLRQWRTEDKIYHKIAYGIEEKADIMAKDIEILENKSKYQADIQYQKRETKYLVEVPVSGRHFIYNSLCAIAVGITLNIEIEKIVEGIRCFELTKKRMDAQIIRDSILVINDSYNASYDSMKASLEYLKEVNGDRKIAVLGDMLELGQYAISLHEKVGNEVVKNKVDRLITVGKLAKHIAEQAKREGMNTEKIQICQDNKEAIALLNKIIKKGDVILLKASNALNFTEILDKIKKE